MSDTSLLAVAMLTELAESSRLYRLDPGRPLKGYLMVAGEGEGVRIDLFLENGRPLSSRSAGEAFYYEGWILTQSQPFSLGAFNTCLAGVGALGAAKPAGEFPLQAATAIRVTAEPFGGSAAGCTPVLEGELVWLHRPGGTDEAGESVAEPEPTPAALAEEPAAPPVEQSAEPNLPPIGSATLAEMAPVPGFAAVAGLNAMPGALPGALPGSRPGPLPESLFGSLHAAPPAPWLTPPYTPAPEPREAPAQFPAPAQGPVGQGQAPPVGPGQINMEELQLEAGTSPTDAGASWATQSIPLLPRHPMAPRASGQMHVNRRTGSLTLTVRGLPSPPSLGREAGTDRPFNAYRVWLLQGRTGARLSLGHCTRVWGDNYRFESEPNLPLARYDTVLITADDRSSLNAVPTAPQVLAGSYTLS